MQEDYGSAHERRSYSKFNWEQLPYDRRDAHSKALLGLMITMMIPFSAIIFFARLFGES